MTFSTYSGKMEPQEIEKLMEVIKLYSTKRTLKSKRGTIPKTHKVKNLKSKNDNWKKFIMEEE